MAKQTVVRMMKRPVGHIVPGQDLVACEVRRLRVNGVSDAVNTDAGLGQNRQPDRQTDRQTVEPDGGAA